MMPALPKPNESSGFVPPPAGTYPAVCFRIVDLGTQPGSAKYPQPKHKVLISWELHDPDTTMEDGKPMIQTERFTWSMDEKATLRKRLEAWRGVAFKDDELGDKPGAFRLENLLGVPCFMGITHSEKDGKIYANVSAISKLPKNMDKPVPVNEKLFVWLSPEEFDPEAFAKLSEKQQELIKSSPEYRRILEPEAVELDQSFNDKVPF